MNRLLNDILKNNSIHLPPSKHCVGPSNHINNINSILVVPERSMLSLHKISTTNLLEVMDERILQHQQDREFEHSNVECMTVYAPNFSNPANITTSILSITYWAAKLDQVCRRIPWPQRSSAPVRSGALSPSSLGVLIKPCSGLQT